MPHGGFSNIVLRMQLHELLEQVARGAVTPEAAAERLGAGAELDLGFSRLDLGRERRCGIPEVIFCSGKTPEQVAAIARRMHEAGVNVFGTRLTPEAWNAVRGALPGEAVYHAEARCLTWDVAPLPAGEGRVVVVSAGTADQPVAEEAALTAERMGARVERVFDVGVAGLHRLTRRLETLRAARVLVVVAGMEGALPSVVGGLVASPVVAVPTSVGYGANLGGLTTLLAMLNSCVPGVTAVNIDNGFGAGVAAALINRVRGEA